MNRRAFLSMVAAGMAGSVLDPERLLWVPGKKTIFLPSIQQPVGMTFTLSNARLVVGDEFTIGGVWSTNPHGMSSGELQRFVVTATTDSDGSLYAVKSQEMRQQPYTARRVRFSAPLARKYQGWEARA